MGLTDFAMKGWKVVSSASVVLFLFFVTSLRLFGFPGGGFIVIQAATRSMDEYSC